MGNGHPLWLFPTVPSTLNRMALEQTRYPHTSLPRRPKRVGRTHVAAVLILSASIQSSEAPQSCLFGYWECKFASPQTKVHPYYHSHQAILGVLLFSHLPGERPGVSTSSYPWIGPPFSLVRPLPGNSHL